MNREVIRCTHCKLVMFRSQRNQCPRCRSALHAIEEMQVIRKPRALPERSTIAMRLRVVRTRCGASQRELALRMGCPRTYISKLEQGACCPTPAQIVRLSKALPCDIAELLPPFIPSAVALQGGRSLLKFMAELYAYSGGLTRPQMVAVRREAKRMSRAKITQVVIVNGVAGKESCA